MCHRNFFKRAFKHPQKTGFLCFSVYIPWLVRPCLYCFKWKALHRLRGVILRSYLWTSCKTSAWHKSGKVRLHTSWIQQQIAAIHRGFLSYPVHLGKLSMLNKNQPFFRPLLKKCIMKNKSLRLPGLCEWLLRHNKENTIEILLEV